MKQKQACDVRDTLRERGVAGPTPPGTSRGFQSLGSSGPERGEPRGYSNRHEAMFFLPGRNEAGHRHVERTRRQAKASREGLGAKFALCLESRLQLC